jgi:hypothetical protein
VGTPPLQKNGRDHAQDAAIKRLHDEFSGHIKDEELHHAQNEKAHGEIFGFLRDTKNDDKWKRRIVAVGWTVLMAVVGALTLWMQSNENRLDGIDSRISHIESEEQSNAARGFGLADHLRRDVDKNENNLREHRRLHRIKPDERNRLRPQEK